MIKNADQIILLNKGKIEEIEIMQNYLRKGNIIDKMITKQIDQKTDEGSIK